MKTLKSLHASLLLVCLLAFPAWVNAQQQGRVFETAAFNALNAGGIYSIQLIQGENHHVEIFGDDNILEKTEVRVRNGVLHLDFKGTSRQSKIDVTVIAPAINSIKLSGAVALASQNTLESPTMEIELSGAASANVHVVTDALKSRLSGAANLTISGEASDHNAGANGAAQLRAQNLQTKTTVIELSGAAHARIDASDVVNADASGSSKVALVREPASKQIKTSGAASVGSATSSTNASGDTTRVRLGSRDIIIIDDNQDGKVKIERNKRRKFRNNWSGLELGINGYVTPERSLNLPGEAALIEPRYDKSTVFNLNLFQQSIPIISNNLGIYTGFGFTWNNYNFDNQTRLVHDREYLGIIEDDRTMLKNRLRTTWINVPLMLELQTSNRRQVERFHIAGGIIVGARIGSNARYVYEDNGKRRREKDYSSFNIAPFRYDLSGRLGWGRINLFANYALNSLFLSDRGPELYPFSVGIRLVNF
jgi:hypothetical protein